jgi:hypothetical protein
VFFARSDEDVREAGRLQLQPPRHLQLGGLARGVVPHVPVGGQDPGQVLDVVAELVRGSWM